MADSADLCTVADVKAAFEPAISGSSRDQRIERLITSASKALMARLGRELAPRATATRTFTVTSRIVDLYPYELRSATTVTLDPTGDPVVLTAGTEYALGAYRQATGTYLALRLARTALDPLASAYGQEFGVAQISVNGAWGVWDTASVPADVSDAVVLAVRAWMRQNPAAYLLDQADTGGTLQPAVPQTWKFPEAALHNLCHLRRMTTV